MQRDEFVSRYGGIYEHSAWVAERVFDAGDGNADSVELELLMKRCVDDASRERKLALIRAHPDLAGRAAVAGELTAESTGEQAAAGIDRCNEEEYARFNSFNARYRDKFGFPFVMAVRNSNRDEILAAFERRLANEREAEFATALREIHTIARLRLEAM